MSVIATELNLGGKKGSKNISKSMHLNEWNLCVQQGLSEGVDYNPGGFGG